MASARADAVPMASDFGGTDPTMLRRFFPEMEAGGFPRHDGTIEFYNRINALLDPSSVLLDFGAGRGESHFDDKCAYRRQLQAFKGRIAHVHGVDVDPVVLTNPRLDSAHILTSSGQIPLPDESVDVVLADWVLEHLEHPDVTVGEFARVLKPDGWVCARTPNRWHYQYLAAQLIPERFHASVLRHVQKNRKSVDVFPKYYRLNDRRAIARVFGKLFDNFTYEYSPPPAYVPDSAILWRIALLVDILAPPTFRTNLYVFARKRGGKA
ncbi:MAG: class I SAM-dependent methyltransferase [Geminicoccaceae bacterium]